MRKTLPVVFLLLLLMSAVAAFAQYKLATGVYKTVAKSSFTYIDASGDTLYLDTVPVCSAADFKTIAVDFDYSGHPVLQVTLTDEGSARFAAATKENTGKKMAIIGNGKLLSAPVVNGEIAGGKFEVNGNFSLEEVTALANRIRKDIPEYKKPEAVQQRMEFEVETACTLLESALLGKDTSALKRLLHTDVSFGHSNGWVEDKGDIIKDLGTGYLSYKTITAVDRPHIKITDHVARVRREIKVAGVVAGTAFDLKLHVLEVWLEKEGQWTLLCRQSIKKQ